MYKWCHSICLSLSDLFHSLTPSKSIHVTTNGNIWFLIFISHIFFIHSSVDGHLECFHISATVNNALLRMLRCEYLSDIYIYPGMEFLGHVVILFFRFLRNLRTVSLVVAPIYIPTNSAQRYPFLHILDNICYLSAFWWWPFLPVWDDNSCGLDCISW